MNVKNVLTAITMFAIVIFMFASLVVAIIPDARLQETKYVVLDGDCLWSIASEYCPKGMNKWEYIDRVYETNNLSSYTIHPGQILTVFETVE